MTEPGAQSDVDAVAVLKFAVERGTVQHRNDGVRFRPGRRQPTTRLHRPEQHVREAVADLLEGVMNWKRSEEEEWHSGEQ